MAKKYSVKACTCIVALSYFSNKNAPPLQEQRKNTILKRRGALDFIACLSKNPYAIECRPYG